MINLPGGGRLERIDCTIKRLQIDRPTDFKWPISEGGRFRQFAYHYNGIEWAMVSGPSKAIKIEEWWFHGGGRLEPIYCRSIWVHTFKCRQQMLFHIDDPFQVRS